VPEHRLTDVAWALIVRAASSGVRGKVFLMARGTMFAIRAERRKSWHPEVAYFLYSVPVRYDDRMQYGEIRLVSPAVIRP
jgi:hypothetical protein